MRYASRVGATPEKLPSRALNRTFSDSCKSEREEYEHSLNRETHLKSGSLMYVSLRVNSTAKIFRK